MTDSASSEYVIAVEIGGTKLQAALGTRSGEILRLESAKVAPGGDAASILSWFEASIPPLLEEASNASVAGIGVGFGGPVNSATGQVITSHQVEGWSGFPIGDWFAERFHVPVRVENDANAAGWAEYCLGAGQGTQTFCYMNVGSGIGGALVIDGKLHNGQGLGAFEIGHTYIPDAFVEEPGRFAKLEDRFSGWSIEQRLRSDTELPRGSLLWEVSGGDQASFSCENLGEAARRGDEYAIQFIEEVATYLGLALANAVTLVHPEVIALGGGVSLLGEVLLEPLRERVEECVFGPYQGTVRIERARLDEDVVIAGGLLMFSDS